MASMATAVAARPRACQAGRAKGARSPPRSYLKGHDGREAEYCRGLHEGGERHEDSTKHGPPAERGHQPRAQQTEHDGVVVRSGDEVQQHERIERAEPQRGGRVGAAVPGQPRQRGRHQCHAEQRDDPHPEQPGGHLTPRQTGQRGGDGEEDRTVRCRGPPPHRRHLVRERTAEDRRPVRVDVDVRVDHRALRQIAVDVPAEQGRREQQRRGPHGEYDQQCSRTRRLGPSDHPPQQGPGGDEQHHSEVHADQPERRPSGREGRQFPYGQGSGRLTSQREDDRAREPEQLTATQIDGETLGQHSVSVSTRGGRKATRLSLSGSRSMSAVLPDGIRHFGVRSRRPWNRP
jgi:hypothetical protein